MHGAPEYTSKPWATHKEVRVTDRRWKESHPASAVVTRRVKPQPRNLTAAQKRKNMLKYA